MSKQNGRVPLLLLDLDNTLVDRDRTFLSWAKAFVDSHGLSRAELPWLVEVDEGGWAARESFCSAIKARFGLSESVSQLVADWGIDFPALYRCDDATSSAVREARARGWRLGIVTNGDGDIQARKVAAAGLSDLVDTVCISGAEGFHKPDPRLFMLAAVRAGNPSGPRWMVGDNPEADIAGGHAADMSTAWVSRYQAWTEATFNPDVQADTTSEAIRLVLASV